MSACASKRGWVLGEDAQRSRYVEALARFPEIELVFEGPLRGTDLPRSDELPDVAFVCGEPGYIDPLVRLLGAGAHLWIESPIASNPDEARALAALAELGDRTLISGTLLARASVWTRTQQQVASGRIGRLHRLEWRAPIKTQGDHIQALEPRDLLAALEVFETLAGPAHALRIEWDSNGRGAELHVRLPAEVEANARFEARGHSSSDPYLVCRGDLGELWVGDGQSVLYHTSGLHEVSAGIDPDSAVPSVVEEILRRYRAGFIEDRNTWLMQRVTDALLHAEEWRPA